MNDTELLKIATRAWKMNFGSLSEASQKLLKSKKILVHDKELAGLNRGTANIIKANGGVQKNLTLVESVKEMKKHPGLAMLKEHGLHEDYSNTLKYAISATQQSSGYYNVTGGGNSIVSSGKYIPGIVGSNADNYEGKKRIHSIIGYNTGSKADSYVKGILDRHEADELRYTMKARRTKGQHASVGGTMVELTNTPHGHMSNDVILRESAHVAIAPKYTHNAFKNTRNEASLEPDYIRGIVGSDRFEYGKQAIPSKKLSRALTKEQVKVNKDNAKDYANLNNLSFYFN